MLKYFTLQVKSRNEGKYIKLFNTLHPGLPFALYAPQRSLGIRRKGIIKQTTSAVFPGYVFVETEEENQIAEYRRAFQHTAGFYRFLKSNQNIRPLSGRDLELILHFIKKVGPVAGVSLAYFNEDARIMITEGPLLGLEGKIIKVDKRKGRAKIKLDLYGDSFAIDLPFKDIGKIPGS
jgi:transcriptional antiterminator NusG